MLKTRPVKGTSSKKVSGGFEVKAGDLLSVLKKAKPALTYNDIVPVLSHFCFDGKSVFAYDDVSAIEVELEDNSGMSCAVPGDALFRVLSSLSPDTQIRVEQADGSVVIHYGKSEISFFSLPRESFLFDPTTITGFSLLGDLSKEKAINFLACLKTVLFSMGNNAASEYELGVNVRFRTGGWSHMLTTDGMTITRAGFDDKLIPSHMEVDLLLPSFFCNYLMESLDWQESGLVLEFHDGSVAARDSAAWVFSRIPYSPDVDRINAAIDRHYGGDTHKRLSPIREREALSEILNRCIIVSSDDYQNRTDLTFDGSDRTLTVEASGKYGKVREVLGFKAPWTEVVKVSVDPALVRRALLQPTLEYWCPGKSSLVLSDKEADLVHLISAL